MSRLIVYKIYINGYENNINILLKYYKNEINLHFLQLCLYS